VINRCHYGFAILPYRQKENGEMRAYIVTSSIALGLVSIWAALVQLTA
jgi:hypothetical protein